MNIEFTGDFYFDFCRMSNKKESLNKTSIDNGLQTLKDILNQNTQQGGDLLEIFQGTLSKGKELIAFLTLFPHSSNVKKTTYPESIQIGGQTLQLKNVPGDGNCGIWSLLQLMNPEKNYLECFNANPFQEKEAMATERQKVAEFAQQNGADDEVVSRIKNPNQYLYTEDFKYFAQRYKKDIVICVNQDTHVQYETYHAYSQDIDINFEQPSYNQNAYYVYYQNEHFQALSPQNES